MVLKNLQKPFHIDRVTGGENLASAVRRCFDFRQRITVS
jgi:hypothetical protein